MDRLKDVNVHITAGSIVTVFLFGILAALLWFLRDIVLIVLTAIVIASAIEPGVHFFRRYGINRVFGVIIIYAVVISLFFSVIFLFIPPLLSDAANFLTRLPATLSSLNLADATHGLLPNFGAGSAVDLLQNLSQTIAQTTGGVFTTLSAFFGGVTSFVLIVVFSFYFSVQETGVDDFLRVVTPSAHQAYVLNLWKRSQTKIGKWMQGQLILGVIVGVLLYLGLTILGIPNALLLAAMAALFELIPVFGQILAAIPAVAIGFVDGGVTGSLLVAGLYLVVQQFEAHLIYPVVVKKVVGVPPLMVILSLIVGAKLAGFLGILLSVPIAGAIQEFVADVDRRKTQELSAEGFTPEGDVK
ncbi:MAG TPA: AI-2E family transporter [Candidatus Paceibacterota bacterium]|jgi:predicted PurR-regulated permease PerM|nr:AI-2E family transporter [Candidatus Paceibacterota bacterium]